MSLRILISPNAYKGTLSPTVAADLMSHAIQARYPSASIISCPLADGGDGTLDVLMAALRGRFLRTRVHGPLGKKVSAAWGFFQEGPDMCAAVIEMARASGLALLSGRNKILDASSAGTGELIRAALDQKCLRILIGVGGTASSDGGAGALAALGFRFYDARNHLLLPTPRKLAHVVRIDKTHIDPRLSSVELVVLCDVKNPLLGPKGSARTFGPQKGASPLQTEVLERFLSRWSRLSRIGARPSVKAATPGAGAAGALAFGLGAFLGAKLVDGGATIMKAVGWAAEVEQADWIVTGEGRLDPTSFSGKIIGQIIQNRGSAKVAVVCGTSAFSRKEAQRRGIDQVVEMGASGLQAPRITLRTAVKQLTL